MKRKILSLLLCLSLLFSLLPSALAEDIELLHLELSEPEDDIQLVELTGEDPDGSAGKVAEKLQGVLERYPDGSTWQSSYDGAVQCYGFAGLVVNQVFGSTPGGAHRWWTYSGENKAGMVLVDQITSCTEYNICAMLTKARPGDVLQFDRGPNGHQHSMIVYDILRSGNEVTGAVIYECNWYSSCEVSLRSLTNLQLSYRQACGDGTQRAKLSLLSADNWETVNGGPYRYGTQDPEASTLALSGEVFPDGHYDRLYSFDLQGVFQSNYNITRIESTITDSQGRIVLIYDTPWSKAKYNIQTDGLNYAFRFGTLGDDSYTFRVCATDSSGNAVEACSSFDLGRTVNTPGPELNCAASTGGLALSWNAIDGAGYYQLQRLDENAWITIADLTETAYTDEDLFMGESCRYRARAHLSNGWTGFGQELDTLYNPFTDVPSSGKTLEYISWAYNNGVITGVSSSSFAPDRACTRVQFVLMLWKMHGSPAASGSNPFRDVSGAKTTQAILWALERGIINSGKSFYPNDPISREQIVMILWKLAGSPAASGANPFRDVSGAKTTTAVLWAYQNGITRGTSANTFSPAKNCTRVQLVVFLYKYNAIYQVA